MHRGKRNRVDVLSFAAHCHVVLAQANSVFPYLNGNDSILRGMTFFDFLFFCLRAVAHLYRHHHVLQVPPETHTWKGSRFPSEGKKFHGLRDYGFGGRVHNAVLTIARMPVLCS